MFKRLSILIALLGLGLAIYVVATAKEKPNPPPPAAPPSVNPFERGLAAIGIVETATRDVAVAAPEPGRVTEVMAQVVEAVTAGQPLFKLDTVALDAALVQARAAADAAQADITRWETLPRAEDVPPLRAAVDAAQAAFDSAQDRLERMQAAMQRGNAVTDDELARQRFAVAAARALLEQAKATLARTEAGAWSQDLAVAKAQQAQRHADIRSLEMRIERLTVRSPISGTILRRNVEPGEYAASSPERPAFIVGDLARLNVRAEVAEEDTAQLRAGAKAIARVRGSVALEIPLEMIRIEPFAAPKRQITGANTELVDTRVIEVLFATRPKPGEPLPIYPGQALDVFIEAHLPASREDSASAPKPN